MLDLLRLREALEASWDDRTAYPGAVRTAATHPSFGQCYPTARVVQRFVPAMEIASGTVWTGASEEHHFWNVWSSPGALVHVDLSWQQFPHGSIVRAWKLLDRHALGDSAPTLARVELLYQRVLARLA